MLLQSLEACEVEPMLFVFKHSNLISHDRIRSLKLCLNVSWFIRFISGMELFFFKFALELLGISIAGQLTESVESSFLFHQCGYRPL